MQIEHSSTNLKNILEDYLNNPGYSDYPELDLVITGNETLGDDFQNNISSYFLWNEIQKKLNVSSEEIEQNPLIWETFIGTKLRLNNWKFFVSQANGNRWVDLYCKNIQ